MLRAIVFHGKKQFTAEYYSTEIKNRSYGANQANGYYKGYGNELRYAIISDRTFRINSGLFTVQGRQCAVVLGTQEDVLVPAQEQEIKGYIIARINTNVLTGDNVELDYKLGTNSSFPTLVQQETYSIDENTSAIYELPLYSFTIYRSITNVVRMIKPIKNMQVQIDDLSLGVSDYLYENGLYIRKIDNKYYEFYKFDGENLSKLNVNADYINGNTLDVALQNKADLVDGKLPVSQLPETGITADTANAVAYGTGQTYSGDKIVEIDNKNLYHLGAFDVYPYSNDSKLIYRRTGYANIHNATFMINGSYPYANFSVIIDTPYYAFVANNNTVKVNKACSPYGNSFNWGGKCGFSFARSTNFDNVKDFLYFLQDLEIQFLLPEQYFYVDSITTDSPLNTLDVVGSSWLKNKWEDQLNVFDFSQVKKAYTTSGNSYSQLNFEIWSDANYTTNIATLRIWTDGGHIDEMTGTIPADGVYFVRIGVNGNAQDNKRDIGYYYFEKGSYTFNGYFSTLSTNEVVCEKLMLCRGTRRYIPKDYNQKEHISNDEAILLKNEYNKTVNLFDKDTITVGYGVIAATGALQADSSLATSDYIELKTGLNYINNLKGGWSGYFGICFYDSNKTFLEGYNTNISVYNHFDLTNANAKYVRFCWFNDSSDSTYYSNPDSIMFNIGTVLSPHYDFNGRIAHMKDLELYGSRPAVASANFIEDWSAWLRNSSTYNPGTISAARQRVSFLPLGSHNSIIEARAEYVSGTTDFVECRVSVMDSSSSYADINFYNINTTHPTSGSGTYSIYGPNMVNGSGGSYYRSKSTTFKVTIKDMYGNVYTKNYTIDYAIHQSQE